MSRPKMRENQGRNAMRDATFSRRDMLWAGARSPLLLHSRSRLRPLPPSPAGLAQNRHLGWIRRCPR